MVERTRIVHFVAFRGEEYWSAVKVWGPPHIIHPGWDKRALWDIGEEDLVVFARGTGDDEPQTKSFNDLNEEWLDPARVRQERQRLQRKW